MLIRTEGGLIRAERIVYATGYESGEFLDRPKGNLNSTYALASEPKLNVPGWPDQCLIWETARPYFYAAPHRRRPGDHRRRRHRVFQRSPAG